MIWYSNKQVLIAWEILHSDVSLILIDMTQDLDPAEMEEWR